MDDIEDSSDDDLLKPVFNTKISFPSPPFHSTENKPKQSSNFIGASILSTKTKKIVGIDPGPVNCGVCIYDLENDCPISIERISFREKNTFDEKGKKEVVDPGSAKLLDNVAAFINERFDDWKDNNVKVFIEDQVAGRKDKGDESGVIHGEVSAVQYGIQALLGSKMCCVVAPRSVKCHFRQYFPQVEEREDEAKFQHKKRQYQSDKQNAIKNGKQFVPMHISEVIKKDKKRDDYYDSLWICKWASDVMKGKPGYKESEKMKVREAKHIIRESNKRVKEEEKERKRLEREEKKKEKEEPKERPIKRRARDGCNNNKKERYQKLDVIVEKNMS